MANENLMAYETGGDAPSSAANPNPLGNMDTGNGGSPTPTPQPFEEPATPTSTADPIADTDTTAPGVLNFTSEPPTEPVGSLLTGTQATGEVPAEISEEKPAAQFSIWLIVVIVVLLAAIAAVTVKLIRNSKKNKRREEMRDMETRPIPPSPQKPSTRVPVRKNSTRPASSAIVGNTVSAAAMETRSVPLETTPAAGSYKIGFAQTVGARENQEDSYCISNWKNPQVLAERGLLAAVADGIGGLRNGQYASGAVVRNICARFDRQDPQRSMSDRLLELAAQAQQDVLQINMHGERCGTTLVAVLVQKKEMVLLSVGDSRIALYRAGTLLQMNREHILGRENDEKLALSMDGETLDKRKQGALTSYLGKENLRTIDRTLKPIHLVPGDRILLMSDGVFGTLKDSEIIEKLRLEPDQAAKAIIQAVDERKRSGQDNATIVIVGID